MRFLPIFLAVSLPVIAHGQTANRAMLTLVEEEGFNEVEVALDVELIGASDDTSELTGTIEVQLNISPTLGTTDEMTILSAEIAGSDVELERGGTFANYALLSSGFGFNAATLEAPGVIDPATGEFDAAQHEITVNRGTFSGTAFSFLTGTQDLDIDFEAENFSGTGIGTGTVELDFLRFEGRKMYFEVTLEIPVELDEPIIVEGNPVEADTMITGTMKARGETYVELEDYASWAGSRGLAEASENDFDLSPTTPNALLFALGLERSEVPSQVLNFTENGVTLTTGRGMALDDLEIQWSSDLTTWERVPQSAMASGASMITAGDSLAEPITVRRDAGGKFFRLARVTAN